MTLVFRPAFGWGKNKRIVFGLVLIGANYLFFRGSSESVFWDLALIVVTLGLLNELRVVLGLYYVLTNEAVVLVAWPFRWRFPLDMIKRVTQGKRWWSVRLGENSLRKSLTLSSSDLAFAGDYIVIEFWDGRATRISPADKDGFVSVLRARAPYAMFEGL